MGFATVTFVCEYLCLTFLAFGMTLQKTKTWTLLKRPLDDYNVEAKRGHLLT